MCLDWLRPAKQLPPGVIASDVAGAEKLLVTLVSPEDDIVDFGSEASVETVKLAGVTDWEKTYQVRHVVVTMGTDTCDSIDCVSDYQYPNQLQVPKIIQTQEVRPHCWIHFIRCFPNWRNHLHKLVNCEVTFEIDHPAKVSEGYFEVRRVKLRASRQVYICDDGEPLLIHEYHMDRVFGDSVFMPLFMCAVSIGLFAFCVTTLMRMRTADAVRHSSSKEVIQLVSAEAIQEVPLASTVAKARVVPPAIRSVSTSAIPRVGPPRVDLRKKASNAWAALSLSLSRMSDSVGIPPLLFVLITLAAISAIAVLLFIAVNMA